MNLASYEAIAEQWDRHRIRLSPLEEEVLLSLAGGLPTQATLLDLGCGSGQPVATYFAAAGHRIIGVDQSPAMLALAQRRLPEQRWMLAAIEDFIPPERVDAAIAWDSLFHIPRERHAGVFERVRAALAPGGRFALTVGGSEHPAFTDSMFGQRFFYDSHPPERAVALLHAAGFRVELRVVLNHPDGGRDKGRVALVAAAV